MLNKKGFATQLMLIYHEKAPFWPGFQAFLQPRAVIGPGPNVSDFFRPSQLFSLGLFQKKG